MTPEVIPPWLTELVDARRAEPWPRWLSPALVDSQSDVVRDVGELIRPIDINRPDRDWRYLIRTLALVKCARCMAKHGTLVGSLDLYGIEYRDDGEWGRSGEWRGGAVYRGTRKATDGRFEVRDSYRQRGQGSRPVPGDAQYLACIEILVGELPPRLPAWCDHHGTLSVPLDQLQRAARAARVEPEIPRVTIRV